MTPGRGALVVATGNRHKLQEFAQYLSPHGYVVSMAQEGFAPVEDGDSFAANAAIKARALTALLHAQTPASARPFVLADDSGLVVPALGGAPGILSARYAEGEPGYGQDADAANREKLLRAMEGVPDAQRSAWFECALALLDPAGVLHAFVGEVHGHIAQTQRGGQGFGYDALFVPVGSTTTFAEGGPALKAALSHRSRAIAALLRSLTAP